jgi:hypothetical protein
MPKAYSGDLRVRVIEMVQAGVSRREAAEVFSLAGSSVAATLATATRAACELGVFGFAWVEGRPPGIRPLSSPSGWIDFAGSENLSVTNGLSWTSRRPLRKPWGRYHKIKKSQSIQRDKKEGLFSGIRRTVYDGSDPTCRRNATT